MTVTAAPPTTRPQPVPAAANQPGPAVRPPSGRPSWPLVLVEGPEKAGKSYLMALLSASKKVGRSFWLDLGEGSGDEYGAIPGARHEILVHDGTWRSIMQQVRAVRDYAAAELQAGRPPVVLMIDSGTAEWRLNSEWADKRARARKKIDNPDTEVQITMDLWNDATTRHYQLWRILMRFPGIAVVTARGGEVAEVVGGKPTGEKVYKVEGHKNMAYDASLWVQLSREHNGVVMGVRSVRVGIRPGKDKPKPIDKPDWDLEWLLFEVLGLDELLPEVRPLTDLETSADEKPETARAGELRYKVVTAANVEALSAVWTEIPAAGKADEITVEEYELLKKLVGAKFDALKPAVDQPSDGTTPGSGPEGARQRADQADTSARPAGADQ